MSLIKEIVPRSFSLLASGPPSLSRSLLKKSSILIWRQRNLGKAKKAFRLELGVREFSSAVQI